MNHGVREKAKHHWSAATKGDSIGVKDDLTAAETDVEVRAFYGDRLEQMVAAEQHMLAALEEYRSGRRAEEGFDPVDHCKSRIKHPASMKRKLQLCGQPFTQEAALTAVTDAIGVRIICYFLDDVYAVADFIRQQMTWAVIKESDYIAKPKPNGYRSYHLVVRMTEGEAKGLFVEVQIRTLANDCWASLEHVLKYKKNIAHESLIREELKRCADELASTDLSLQTLKDLISENDADEGD
jgi:putative GTP pyrophosphokinase